MVQLLPLPPLNSAGGQGAGDRAAGGLVGLLPQAGGLVAFADQHDQGARFRQGRLREGDVEHDANSSGALAADCSHAPAGFAMPARRAYLLRSMTELLQADEAGIARAAALLRAGELVAFGTETVYGLGADATNAEAVARVFEAKGRPRFNPLICHYPDAGRGLRRMWRPTRRRSAWRRALWPGPLTLVLPRRPDCPVALLTGAGLDTLAVRVPATPGGARVVARGGAAGGGALGQSVGPGQPDHRAACAGRAGRADCRGAGQRPLSGGG